MYASTAATPVGCVAVSIEGAYVLEHIFFCRRRGRQNVVVSDLEEEERRKNTCRVSQHTISTH
jgi:hypothetical protein